MASNIPVIVQGNSFSLAIPLQIYYINGDQMDLQDYTPDPTDEVSVQLKGSRRNYTYTPTIDGNVANIDLSGNELADNYSVVVSIVKANGQRLRSFRSDQFFIVESSDDLTTDDIIQGLEENVIYLNASIFIAGADGRGIESIVKTATAGLVDTYTITYTDATTSTFNVTNGAAGQQGADGIGITSIEKTATVGLVDTYTITLSNGDTSTFNVTNGQDGHDLGLASIINNLNSDSTEDALSASMGKKLGDEVMPTKEIVTSTLTWTRKFAIDTNSDSATFGQPKTASNSYAYCDYVECGDFKQIKINCIVPVVNTNYDFAGLVFYDADKKPIMGYRFPASSASIIVKNLIIPVDAKYFRTSYWYGDIGTFPNVELYRDSLLEIAEMIDGDETIENLYWVNKKAVDAIENSATFGQLMTASASYYTCQHIYCKGFDYLKTKTIVVQIGSNYDFAGLVFYDADKVAIKGYNYQEMNYGNKDIVLPIPNNACYYRRTFWSNPTTDTLQKVSPFASASDMEQIKVELQVLELPPLDKCTGAYIGEKILLDTHPFGFESYFTASKSGSTARQGAACYGETLFTFHNTNDTVEVFNMRTKTRTQVISPSGGSSAIHCNTANFSKQFYDANDPFPLLYLSNTATEVWRITGTEGNYTMSLVQTISGNGADIYIAEDGTFWQIGWGGGATWDANPNGLGYMRFRQYPIPSISQSEATFDQDTYIKEIRATWRYSLQGSFIKGNKLFFLWGGAGNSGVDVIDLGSGGALSSISLSANGFIYEPEAVFEYDGALYITAYGSHDVFRLYT